jgi:hypothetical protein
MTQARYSGGVPPVVRRGLESFLSLFRKRERDQLLSGIGKSYDRAMEGSRAESRFGYENKYFI